VYFYGFDEALAELMRCSREGRYTSVSTSPFYTSGLDLAGGRSGAQLNCGSLNGRLSAPLNPALIHTSTKLRHKGTRVSPKITLSQTLDMENISPQQVCRVGCETDRR